MSIYEDARDIIVNSSTTLVDAERQLAEALLLERDRREELEAEVKRLKGRERDIRWTLYRLSNGSWSGPGNVLTPAEYVTGGSNG